MLIIYVYASLLHKASIFSAAWNRGHVYALFIVNIIRTCTRN